VLRQGHCVTDTHWFRPTAPVWSDDGPIHDPLLPGLLPRRAVLPKTAHRGYPSDLSKARWELIEPTLLAWRAARRSHGLDIGRPPVHDLRAIMNAIVYVDRTGIGWRYLPHDFPAWETVYALLHPLPTRRDIHPTHRAAATSGARTGGP
jgi:transposase